MSAIIEFVPPAELLFQPADKKSPFANRKLRPIRLSPIVEPEPRFGGCRREQSLPSSR